MARLTFYLSGTLGEERLKVVRERLAGAGEGLRPVMRRIGLLLQRLFEARFERARGAQSSGVNFEEYRWEPLTAAYDRAKRAGGYADWLMVRDRSLMTSLTEQGAPDSIFRALSTRVEVGSRDRKLGYEWLTRKRPVMFLNDSDRRSISESFAEEVRGLWTGSLDRVRAAYAARKAAKAEADAR